MSFTHSFYLIFIFFLVFFIILKVWLKLPSDFGDSFTPFTPPLKGMQKWTTNQYSTGQNVIKKAF